MKAILPVENGDPSQALRTFLRALLEAGLVEALLLPMRTPGGAVVPALVADPALLAQADPLATVLPVNSAALAGRLSLGQNGARVGAVLRACELRALVELSKMQQASLDGLLLIALDCAGTYSVPVYGKKRAANPGNELAESLYQAALNHPEAPDPELRSACKICDQPVYEGAHIAIELLGSDLSRQIQVSIRDEFGERLSLDPAQPVERAAVLERLVAARTAQREAELGAMRARLEGEEKISGVLAACIRCHNCMTVCPICYCRTCVFKSPVFDHEPEQYLSWARHKGACRLPADTILFHLTRMNHMALSCVGCGMCTEACPAELPVGIVFRTVAQRLQEVFDYHPGRSPAEPLPLVTFKADEWTEVGE